MRKGGSGEDDRLSEVVPSLPTEETARLFEPKPGVY